MEKQHTSLWQVVKGYFNALPDKEDEEQTIRQISSDAVFHGSNLWVLIFAIFTASLGLNVNSTAVIIGAMLISPLMGPIIAIGLSVGISDLELLKRAFKNFAVATFISVVTAMLYFLITPIDEARSELLARTSPTLYDVLIALCGGAAGILALSTRGKGNVIPGVAIATALMPPLCTAGYGLAMGELSYFLGAFYLYFINTVFICVATFLGVRMLRFRYKTFVEPSRMARVKRYIIAIVVLTMIPATYMTMQIIRQSVTENYVQKYVKNILEFKGTQVISHKLDKAEKVLTVVAVGKTIPAQDMHAAEKQLDTYGLEGYRLNIIQGSLSDSTLAERLLRSASTNAEATNRQFIEQSSHLHEMEERITQYARYDNFGGEIRNEVRTLWPAVRSLSLSKVTESSMDSVDTRRYVVAIAGCRRPLNDVDRRRFRQWLKARTRADSLRLIVTP